MSPSRKKAPDLVARKVRRAAREHPLIPVSSLGVPAGRALAENLYGAYVVERETLTYQGHDLAGVLELRDPVRIAIARRYGAEVAAFTLLHELGHLEMHRGGEELTFRDLPGAAASESLYTDSRLLEMEREANEFAAELMMPARAVRELFEWLWRRKSVSRKSVDDDLCAHLRLALDEQDLARKGLSKENLTPSALRQLSDWDIAWLLSIGRPVGSTWSLADAFSSSPTAMSVRLSRLGLGPSDRPPQPRGGSEKAPDLFASYNSADRALVTELIEELRRVGITVWSDQDLLPGQQGMTVLGRKLERSRALAVFVGPSGISDFQELELSAVLTDRGGSSPVIPVLLPGVAPDFRLPLLLRSFQILDGRKNPEALVERLLQAITVNA